MKSRIYLLAAMTGLSVLSYRALAQDETDALRYSFLSPQATARSIGIAGALGSIGGDFSSLSVNPAGIGIYRSSEFMITPSIKSNSVSGTYIGQTTDDNQVRFTVPNIGVVFTSTAKGKRYQRSDWKSVSFGLGINRLADFNRTTTYSGVNSGKDASSFGEVFVTDAINYGSINDASTPAGIGWQSFLVDTFIGGGYYSPVIAATPAELRSFAQRRTVTEHGGISEIVLSLGGNYQEKFMLGATLGLPVINYTRDMTFEETDASGIDTNYYKSLVFNERLTTTGLGINLKLGFIFKPNDNVRLGVALHTPTYYGLTDVQNRSITTETEGLREILGYPGTRTVLAEGSDIPEATFQYSLTTPWRAVISATGFLGQYGFITADYEYVDYQSARFHFDGYGSDEATVNQLIRNSYKGASNFRIGAEGRLDRVMIRLGFGYYGNPYKNDNSERIDVSGGIGYRFDAWYLDLGYMHSQYQQQQQPYHVVYPDPVGEVRVPTATLKNSLNNVALTLGWKF